MQKLVDFIASKAIADTSMAMALKMINENVGLTEDCLLLLFDAMYTTNKQLADEIVKYRRAERGKVVLSETSIFPSSNSKPSR